MKPRGGMILVSLSAIVLLVGLSGMAAAYPAGPQLFVTDLAPNCATCHAMLKAEYTPERPRRCLDGRVAHQ